MESRNIRKHLIVIGAVLAGIILFVMLMAFISKFPLYLRDSIHNRLLGGGGGSKLDNINHISFSPDGKKLLFNRCEGKKCNNKIHVYDLTTGELGAYQAPQGEYWTMGRYSYDGRNIVFVVTPLVCSSSKCENDFANMQIAMMDPDGRNVRVITNTPGVKIHPSFSHKGKKIIFAKAGKITEGFRTPAMDYDFFEVDAETGKETRLTHFRFFEVSPPFYLPDDKTFIFSAYGPSELVNIGMSLTNKSKYEYLHAKYDRDNIYRLRAGQQELEPYVMLGKEQPRKPLVTPSGKHLFFHAQAYKPDGKGDGAQFFRYFPDGKHQRVSHLDDAMQTIWSSAVSPDGALLATVGGGKETRRIGICRVADENCQILSLPDEAAIINQLR
jgi:Tol biopolymer transport system component